MSVLTQMFKDMEMNISPVQLGEIVIILAIVVFAAYVFYSLNLFRKER